MQLVDVVAGKAITNPNVLIALCGVTKMFVGELVETARMIATRANHFGPLMPVHIYEAHRTMQADKKSVNKPKRARLFQ
jgi:transcription initiation factor TFIID subunit 11